MLAYKTQIRINDNFINLRIPVNFVGKKVEIIILETDIQEDENEKTKTPEPESFYDDFVVDNDIKTTKTEKPNDFQKFLLSAPIWNDNQYNNFLETRKLFNQWKIS